MTCYVVDAVEGAGMSSPLDEEIRGDWNNLKGTHYHLVYALWLLLRRNAGSVAFYRGNDLLARIAPPPAPEEVNTISPAIHIQDENEDEWIQLKATRDPWTRTAVLQGNLLANFIYNALASEAAGRGWRARLVTQGEIRRTEIKEFVENPTRFRQLARILRGIIHEVRERLHQNSWQPVDEARLRTLALTILQQLAQEEPVSLAQLKAEVDLQLTYRYISSELVQQVGNTLLGALLQDAAAGPAAAHVYNDAWLDQTAGAPLKSRLPFDTDPIIACDEAVHTVNALPDTHWQAQRCAERVRLENALQHFLQAPQTLFVLLGMSGAGKTWAVADWTARVLQGRARLLIPGPDLDHEDQRALSRLVALRLRPLTTAPISDEDVLTKLCASARIEGHGPLVIVVDDLTPTGDTTVFRRDLARLVTQCRAAGIKLVLTCQTHVWDFYRLGQDIPPGDIYLPDLETLRADPVGTRASGDQARDVDPTQPRSISSFSLPDFTPEEQEQALNQRLPNGVVGRISHLLRAPAFAPLRHPYLLERYLEQHSHNLEQPDAELVPVDVDALLYTRLKVLLQRGAAILNVDDRDVQEAFDILQQQLWANRAGGLSSAQAEICFEKHLRGRSGTALDALRRVGILTARGRVRFSEPSLADYIFARALQERYLAGDDVLSELRLEDDAGVVSALLRSLAYEDPVTLAEALLKRDPRWVGPVGEGLAQCSSQDYRVLAFLTVMTRLDEGAIRFEGCDALGQLAARGHREKGQRTCGRRAFEWILQYYLSSRHSDRFLGARALSATLDLAPTRVERAIRLRLVRAACMANSGSSNREKLGDWLHDALLPLLAINHPAAAEVGERILARYTFLGGLGTQNPDDRFLQEIDEARGGIALFEDAEMERILADLHAPEAETRSHAASALRSVMFEQPERIQEDLCETIRRETDRNVMNQLLWATYRLTELAPDAILDALTGTFALDWSTPSSSTGLALSTLSNLAQQRPERVIPLLPQRLDAYPAWSRAWLSEELAFAWWTCAERVPEARKALAYLATPDLADVPGECQLFALRGAVVAQLGLLCLGVVPMREMHGRQSPYPKTDMQFLFVNTTDFVRSHAADLIAQPDTDQLLDLLVRCLIEENRAGVHPIHRPLFAAHGICASLCLEMLILLAAVHPDPVALVRRLPPGWRLVYAVRRLLESGRKESSVIDFARALCDASIIGRSTQELDERERLFMQLARLSQTPTAALQELRTTSLTSPFTADGRASAVAELTDENPGDMLDLLAQNLEQEDDLAALHKWVERARSWQGLLIARVYARMFEPRPIHRVEARELCEQMLTAVRALPASTPQRECLTVYEAIVAWLEGSASPLPTLPTSSILRNAIERSHAVALELLQHASARSLGEHEEQDWLVDALVASQDRGWWNRTGLLLDGDAVGFGSSQDLVYVFPAVRLALLAAEAADVGSCAGDPAARFLAERASISKLLAEHHAQLDPQIEMPKEYLERTLTALEEVGSAASRDERVRLYRGLLLLRLDSLPEAELELQRCLGMSTCTGDSRASVLYNLACVYARTGREDLCRTTLQEALQIQPRIRQSLETDRDFAEVRGIAWFQTLSHQAM